MILPPYNDTFSSRENGEVTVQNPSKIDRETGDGTIKLMVRNVSRYVKNPLIIDSVYLTSFVILCVSKLRISTLVLYSRLVNYYFNYFNIFLKTILNLSYRSSLFDQPCLNRFNTCVPLPQIIVFMQIFKIDIYICSISLL